MNDRRDIAAERAAQERWLPIPDYPGYEVSSLGRVRSVDRISFGRRYRGKVIALHVGNEYGHLKAMIRRNGRPAIVWVHIAVCAAFHGPCPVGHEVGHRDGVPAHNFEGNLRWVTPAGNAMDKREHGTLLMGERHPSARLTKALVSQARVRLGAGETHAAIAKSFRVSRGTISAIARGETWGR